MTAGTETETKNRKLTRWHRWSVEVRDARDDAGVPCLPMSCECTRVFMYYVDGRMVWLSAVVDMLGCNR